MVTSHVYTPQNVGRIESVSRPVSRVLSGHLAAARDGHSSWRDLAATLTATYPDAPTQKRAGPPCERTWRPYSVLLPVGFTVPPPLPDARWALTPPFHPCRSANGEPVVCFLLHCPWGHPRRALPGTVFPWSPDFPPRTTFRRSILRWVCRATIQSADGTVLGQAVSGVKAKDPPQSLATGLLKNRTGWSGQVS